MTTETRLTEMVTERQKRKDPSDFPLSMTQHDASIYAAHTAELDGRITHARDAQSTLAKVTSELEPFVKWRAHLIEWREQFCKALLGIDADDHDRATEELRAGLRHSILCVDRGAGLWPNGVPMLGAPLAAAIREARYPDPSNSRPGPAWFGPLPEAEKQIKEIQKRIDTAQAALDNALLTDAERQTKEAESAAYGRTYNAMNLTIGKDGRLVPHRANGSEMPETELTPAQKKVLARANAAQTGITTPAVEVTAEGTAK